MNSSVFPRFFSTTSTPSSTQIIETNIDLGQEGTTQTNQIDTPNHSQNRTEDSLTDSIDDETSNVITLETIATNDIQNSIAIQSGIQHKLSEKEEISRENGINNNIDPEE